MMRAGLPYELRIGKRYLRSTGNRFLSFISLISMLGVAIGVAVLIVVLSVMNGFERELRGRILSLTSHASISAFGPGIEDWRDVVAKLDSNPEVAAAAPYIEDQGLLIAGGKSSIRSKRRSDSAAKAALPSGTVVTLWP